MGRTEVCADAMTRLDDLANLAKTLNKQSDQINTILSDFERKLDKMNLGIEVWLGLSALTRSGSSFTINQAVVLAEKPNGEVTEYRVLGYGRVFGPGPGPAPSRKTEQGPRYGLVVRTEHWRGLHDESEDPFEMVWVSPPSRLLQASRELRVKALDMLDQLLEELENETQRVLSSIDKGRKTTDTL